MVFAHFGLDETPFQLNSDPRFLWSGPRQQEVLNTLQYGIEENKGLLLLTGEVGTGKTTLISALAERVGDRVVVARLPDPGLTRKEFFHFVADGFGIKDRVRSKERFAEHLGTFLETVAGRGRRALLVVDEAQIMTPGILQEVRLLSNLEIRNRKLLSILLVGQNELLQKLHRPENDAVRKRIAIRCLLEPLQRNETEAYILHRLATAGCRRPLFTPAAFDRISAFSGGYPRQINILCDLALYFGCEAGVDIIDRQTVVHCEARIRIPDQPGPASPIDDHLPVPVFDPARAPAAGSARRPVWIGMCLALVLLPCVVLLFGSSRTLQRLQEGRFWKTMISEPVIAMPPAVPWAPARKKVEERRESDLRVQPESAIEQSARTAFPETPAADPPPPVVIIPHRTPKPATERHPPGLPEGAASKPAMFPETAAQKEPSIETPTDASPAVDQRNETPPVPSGVSAGITIAPPASTAPTPSLLPSSGYAHDPEPDPAAIFDWLLETGSGARKSNARNE